MAANVKSEAARARRLLVVHRCGLRCQHAGEQHAEPGQGSDQSAPGGSRLLRICGPSPIELDDQQHAVEIEVAGDLATLLALDEGTAHGGIHLRLDLLEHGLELVVARRLARRPRKPRSAQTKGSSPENSLRPISSSPPTKDGAWSSSSNKATRALRSSSTMAMMMASLEGEIAVERARAHLRRRADLVHRGGMEAVTGEALRGSVEHTAAWAWPIGLAFASRRVSTISARAIIGYPLMRAPARGANVRSHYAKYVAKSRANVRSHFNYRHPGLAVRRRHPPDLVTACQEGGSPQGRSGGNGWARADSPLPALLASRRR